MRTATCACARCRPTTLAGIAPRLAKALVDRRRRLTLEQRERRAARSSLLSLERLIAHRELQLARAQSIGRARYIAARERKLNAARRALPRAQARVREAGA